MNTKSRQVDVSEFLESIAVSEILYCPNPGNAGDSAIAAATYQLFDRMGLQYRFVEWDDDFDASGKTVVYGGGGNLVEKYPHARSFIERHHESAERLVVLPHTIYGHGDLLHQLGRNVFLFCRERRSFEWVRKQTEGPTVYLADDLAFALNTREVLGRELFDGAEAAKQTGTTLLQSIRKRCIPDSEVPNQAVGLRKAANISYNVFGSLAGRDRSVLYALRTDKERTAATLPTRNVDVSLMFEYGTVPRSVAEHATAAILSFFNCFERVVTNRLHGCILAALLGKKVDFYANNYFKNEAVYRFSIEDRYSNVRWRGRWERGE